jgi:hypothetical protein
MHMMTLAMMLDGGPYVPDLVWAGCYIAPPIAIALSSLLGRRQHRVAAIVVALAGSLIAAQRVRFAVGHAAYYQDTREWLVVSFAAVFPLYCAVRYCVNAPGLKKTLEPSASGRGSS